MSLIPMPLIMMMMMMTRNPIVTAQYQHLYTDPKCSTWSCSDNTDTLCGSNMRTFSSQCSLDYFNACYQPQPSVHVLYRGYCKDEPYARQPQTPYAHGQPNMPYRSVQPNAQYGFSQPSRPYTSGQVNTNYGYGRIILPYGPRQTFPQYSYGR
ncbi:hypothetical protein SK128_018975 [Halocaridina rubra]|uniref:Kazal-like domain-containing protein n=1 Tax=Halocaridina rubra TaxID=373956 RepID=A0AAN9ACP5_HALRR